MKRNFATTNTMDGLLLPTAFQNNGKQNECTIEYTHEKTHIFFNIICIPFLSFLLVIDAEALV